MEFTLKVLFILKRLLYVVGVWELDGRIIGAPSVVEN
jgi:hypothetical protein